MSSLDLSLSNPNVFMLAAHFLILVVGPLWHLRLDRMV
jgi:hypothetical protein